MTVNEAIRIMRARAPVVTCGTATIWHIGYIRYERIESVTLTVNDKGKFNIYASCRSSQARDSRTQFELDDIELAPDCPEILRRMIYKNEDPNAEDIQPKELKEIALPEAAKETSSPKKIGKKEAAQPEPAFISIILNDGSYYDVPVSKVEKWKQTYPAVDVEQELREMSDWAESNPVRRKTRKGILAFIRNWLSKEQDKGGSKPARYTKHGDTERSFDIDEFDRFTLGIG